ncbi:MAG: hypothetical protein LCI00_26395 [Chloroflexi bacterium]|nr:hypothetical protein [Chloroflexota bacterium]MCC6892880.1 hypothetical protein [Anaerolineae bacterium]
MFTQQKEITKEDFYRFVALPENRDRNFEYIAGEIVEVVSNNESSEVAAVLIGELHGFIRPSAQIRPDNGRRWRLYDQR